MVVPLGHLIKFEERAYVRGKEEYRHCKYAEA